MLQVSITLTETAQWDYTWDAENRLTVAEQKSLNVAGGLTAPPRKKLEFAYDAQHRRIAKVVREWKPVGGTPQWALTKDLRFVYDGWQMIAELDHTFATGTGLAGSAVNRTFLWGPDLSGSMTGAGGVGGLLSTTYQGITYQACSDANGNVTGLVPVSGAGAGTLVTRFDYDPFGNRVTNAGPSVELCPFGFSSKYLDAENGMVSYELRGYMPSIGRWMSRDPIGEYGGVNLYGACYNNAVDNIDTLGLVPPAKGNISPLPDAKKIRDEMVSAVEKAIPKMDNPFAVPALEQAKAEKWALHWAAVKAWVNTNRVAGGPEWAGVLCRKCCSAAGQGEINQYEIKAHQAQGMSDFSLGRGNACPTGYEAVGWFHSHPGIPSLPASEADWDRYDNPDKYNVNRDRMSGRTPAINPNQYPGPEDPGTLGTAFPKEPQVQTLDPSKNKNNFAPALPGPPAPQFTSARCPQ